MIKKDIFLDYQKSWVADKSDVKVCEKSRRIGLTWAEAADNVLTASSLNGSDIWYVGYNREMTREYIDTCGTWAKQFNKACSEIEEELLVDENKEILSFHIKFNSGFKITALSSRPSNLRGKQGKVIIDEAAFHDDLDGLLKSALAFTIWGGKVAIISTHFGADNKFNELVKDIREGRKRYSLHRITFDDALKDGLYERIKEVTNIKLNNRDWVRSIYEAYGEDADEELRCIPANSGGAYFTGSMVENCMKDKISILRFTPPAKDFVDYSADRYESFKDNYIETELKPLLLKADKDRSYFLGGDFARSGDISSLWLIKEEQNLSLSTVLVVELRNAPFRFQEAIMFVICNNITRFAGAAFDARGNGQQMAESMRVKFGAYRILEVMSSDKFYLEAFPKLKRDIEDKNITIPKDADILNDFRQVRIIKGVPKLTDKRTADTKGKRHGDTAIALAMAVYARNTLDRHEEWSYTKPDKNEYRKITAGY